MATGTVTSEIISDMRNLTDENVADTNTLLTEVANISAETLSVIEGINPDWDSRLGYATPGLPAEVTLTPVGNVPVPITLEDFQAFVDSGDTKPAAYVPNDLGTIIVPTFPNAPAAPLIDTNIAVPSNTIGDAPVSPDINEPETLVLSDVDIPTPPALATIDVPADFTLPDIELYTGTIPTLAVEAPGAVMVYTEEAYFTDLHALVDQRITALMNSNYSGLNPEAEQALYDRSKERELEEQRLNLVETTDLFAASGFPMPTGAMRARLAKLRSDIVNRAESLGRDILVKQADLAQDTTKWLTDAALRSTTVNYEHQNRIADRALQVARTTVELAISVYNAQVTAFNAQLDAIRTAASISETNARILVQKLETFRLDLEAAKLRGDLRAQDLNAYQIQIQGAELVVRLHNARIAQAQLVADFEKTKLDVYRTEIDAFSAQVRAQESKFNLYSAQLGAQESKARIYTAEIQGYSAEIDAKKADIDAQKSVIEAKSGIERSKIDAKRIEIELYRADLERKMAAVEAVGSKYRSDADYWRTAIAFADAEARVGLGNAGIKADVNKNFAAQINQKNQNELQAFIELLKLRVSSPTDVMNAKVSVAQSLLAQTTNISQALGGVQTIEAG